MRSYPELCRGYGCKTLLALLVLVFTLREFVTVKVSDLNLEKRVNDIFPLELTAIPKTSEVFRVNEVSGDSLPRIFPYACIRTGKLTARQLSHIMCIKPLETDRFISGDIVTYGMFEKGEVELVLNLIQLYPNGTLLDLGSNIGTFSTSAAASKYKVVAVDPFPTNLAYIRQSTLLFGSDEYVRFVHNTVSDERELLYGVLNPTNEGGITFISKEEAAKKQASELSVGVSSVTFEEVLDIVDTKDVIVKIDIEGHECKALTSYFTNGKEKTKFIPYVVMEWMHVTKNLANKCPNLQQLIQGFTNSGYSPYSVENKQPMRIEEEKRWSNVMWVHKDAKKDF